MSQKISANYIPDKELIPNEYKKLVQLSNKTTDKLIKNGQKN